MATRKVEFTHPRAAFLAGVDVRRVFKVPRQVFPLAIDPPSVPAGAAHFVRPTDWVVGVVVGAAARCYPAWILDNHHAVNDTLGGTHIAVMHCEICCSNAAYLADYEGRRLTFGTAGLYGGTLAVYDTETGSTWSHGMGVAFQGGLKGAQLTAIQSFQASFAEWLSFYPDTTVMAWSEPDVHPDGRHGHGSRDTFAHAGMYAEPVSTMIVGNDPRLPENEMVITLTTETAQAALPLRTLARAGGLLQGTLGGEPFVTISAGQASAMTGTFYRRVEGGDGQALDFILADGAVVDAQTGSRWRADGLATAGPLEGRRLAPLPTMTNKWHSLACFLPGIEILAHAGEERAVELGDALPVLRAVREAGFAVKAEYELYELELPNGARRGFRLLIAGDPFDLLLFADEADAQDYALCRRHTLQRGACVLASAPARLFKDDLNVQPLADEEIEWSPLVGDARLAVALAEGAFLITGRRKAPGPNIAELCEALGAGGYAISVKDCCPRDAIPPGAVIGAQVEIAGDPFLLYRFADAGAAQRCGQRLGHALAAGCFVLRSDPDPYVIPAPLSTIRKPDEEVGWSPLLADAAFRALVEELVA